MAGPFVHLNFAICDDGRMAADDGLPLDISCSHDWHRVHMLRESYDAVAVGRRTWSGDRPRLTVRHEVIGRPPVRQPERVIFAGAGECEVADDGRSTFVVGRRALPPHVVHVSCDDRDLAAPLAELRRAGIRSLLVEGGPTLLRSFLEQQIYHRLTVYVDSDDPSRAREALGRRFGRLPALSSRPLGGGTLFTYRRSARPRPAAAELLRRQESEVYELLGDKLVYLAPEHDDVAGGPGLHEGDRIVLLGPVPLPIQLGGEARRFDWYVFGRVLAGEDLPHGELANSVLVYGDPGAEEAPLVRLHSGCHTGDVFSSMRCDCGAQLDCALAEIVGAGAGIAVYVTEHEGRGIGLWAKAAAYLLQDEGHDTYEANRKLGYPNDARHYADAAQVLARQLDGRRIRLLSNNPAKREALEACGLEVVETRNLVAGHNEVNHRYLEAKLRMGHSLPGWSSLP